MSYEHNGVGDYGTFVWTREPLVNYGTLIELCESDSPEIIFLRISQKTLIRRRCMRLVELRKQWRGKGSFLNQGNFGELENFW